MIIELVTALRQRDLYLDSKEVADVVWLAAQVAARTPATDAAEELADFEPADEKPRAGSGGESDPAIAKTPKHGREPGGADDPPPAPKDVPLEPGLSRDQPSESGEGQVGLYRRSAGTVRAEEMDAALALRVAAAASIPEPRQLARALRPLMVRVPSSVHFAVDEEATVHRYAETRIMVPVMVPMPERWLDLVLVVDGARSMRIWEQTVQELEPVLERQGAFRNSQLWTLDTEAGKPVLYRGRRMPGAQAHGIREVVDPANDRLIAVVSDCVAPAWDDGRMGRILRVWGRSELVVVLQVLPNRDRLWERTGLGSALPVYLSQLRRGGNNGRIQARPASSYWLDRPVAGPTVPVIPLDEESFARAAALFAARPRAQCLGYSIPATVSGEAQSSPMFGGESLSALACLRRFQANASATAQKLAHYLAAAPLSLPIIRLVRKTMLPEADDGHLAEVLGALLYEEDEETPQDSAAVRYEFHNGVRELLLEGSPVPATVTVLDAVSEYLARYHGGTLDFRAALLDPDALPRGVTETERPFARLQAWVLRRLGGAYARMAERLGQALRAEEAATEKADRADGADVDLPATAAASKPPLASIRLRLPFDQLSPAEFERLCLWLVRREGFEDVKPLGEAGSKQGRDLGAWRDDRLFAFQCKRVQHFTAADAHREIAKIRELPASEQPEEYVFVVSKAVRADTRRLAREAWGDAETCQFWCGSELDKRVKRHSEVLAEFFQVEGEPRSGPRTPSDEARQRFRIFLSSTSENLAEYRERVSAAISRLQRQSVRMETLVAEPRAPLGTCRRRVAQADALVVIIAHRYGWVPSIEQGGDGKKSVTWYEVEAALGAGKPVFAFLVDPNHPWPGAREQDRLTKAKTNKEAAAILAAVRGLNDFRAFLDSRVTRDTFTTPDDLASKIATSLLPWLLEKVLEHSGHEPDRTTPQPADLTAYLEDLVDRTDHINISGVATQHTRGALRYPIERLYTPFSSRGPLPGEADDSALGLHHEKVALADLLPACDRLLIEGQPGAGKTTFLAFAACMLARDCLGVPCPGGGAWRRRHLGMEAAGAAKIPVLLKVADLVALLTDAGAPRSRHDNRQWLLDLIERSCEEDRHAVDRDHWERLLARGDAFLLLDGLDEAADASLRERIFSIFRDACKHWRSSVVVTSRPIETAPLREIGFHSATIEPFGDQEIRTFIGHWVAALHAAEGPARGSEAGRYRESLTEAIVGRSRVKRLAANPVMLTCLCVVHWNEGRLPEGRSRVYRAVVRWLIAARSRLRDTQGFTDLFAWRAFARLALAMMGTSGGKRSVLDLEEAALAIEPLVARERPDLEPEGRRLAARRWLSFECLGSGIVEEVGGKRLRFWHLTFQEFLAALQLAWRGDGEDAEEDWWPVVSERLDDAQWREPMELLPGCLLDEGGVGRVDRLLERVLALRGQDPDLATDARVAGILGRLLRPMGVLGYKPSSEISATYDATLKRSMAIFERQGASRVAVAARITAAEALGRGGDPRLAPGEDNLLEVPGLKGWRLGKYPVAVEDYQRFVEARGYEEPEHWSAEGWATKEKEDWAAPGKWDGQLEHPNRPVTGVSWYEAQAYCSWLSAQRGIKVRLPKEADWQQAATPERGEYPWGEEQPDAERANFNFNVHAPTPVGAYPAGNGAFGHSDLAGNVWEWCADRAQQHIRMLRGGSWYNPAGSLRVAYRDRDHASSRRSVIGFRVSATPASR